MGTDRNSKYTDKQMYETVPTATGHSHL